ncbi:MAG: DUF6709 family protein [Oscillospiraceae bacterium]
MIWFGNRKTAIIIIMIMGLFICCMGAVGIVQAARFRSDISQAYEEQRNDFNTMTSAEFSSDMNVYGDVLYLYGCYCEETTTQTKYGIEVSSRVSGSYYLMPLFQESDEDPKYITVLVKNANSTQAMEDIYNDTLDAWDGKDVEWHDYFLMGKVKPLEDDVRPFLIEYLADTEWYANEAEINKYIIPYQIEEYDPDEDSTGNKIMFAFGLGISAVFFIMYLVLYKPVQHKNSTADSSVQPYINTPNGAQNGSASPYTPPQYAPPQYTPPQDIYNIKQPPSPDEFFNKPLKKEAPKQEEKPAEAPKEMEGLGQPKAQPSNEADVTVNTDDVGAMDGISTDSLSYSDYDEPALPEEPTAEYDGMDGIDSAALPDDYSYDDTNE